LALQRGSFVLVDYTLRIKDTNELVDTTIDEIAKKEGKYDSEKVYEPVLVIVGEGRLIEGFEEHLEQFGEVGKEFEVEIPPNKAYGERDPSKLRTMHIRELVRRGIVPEVGRTVDLDGQVGIVKAVSGGRVLIDFNHPLAGKTLMLWYRVVKLIESPEEKVKYLLHRRYRRIPVDGFKVSLNQGEVFVELPREIYLDRDLQIVKAIVAEEVYKYIPQITSVVYVERYTKLKEERKEEAVQAATAEHSEAAAQSS